VILDIDPAGVTSIDTGGAYLLHIEEGSLSFGEIVDRDGVTIFAHGFRCIRLGTEMTVVGPVSAIRQLWISASGGKSL
jgi:hypothetical protein